MKRIWRVSFITLAILAASLLVLACAEPVVEPMPAPAVQPTPAPPVAPAETPVAPAAPAATPDVLGERATPAPAAPTTTFPEPGRPITIIVPWAAGGGVDLGSRIYAPLLERELGTSVQVLNRPGAGSQVGMSEFVMADPDGYTIGATALPATNGLYLDPERQATFDRDDFLPLALHVADPGVVAVRADSPFQTFDELIEAARAAPESITASTTGVRGSAHMAALQVTRATGAEFALVHFEGFAPSQTALLGGHIDVQFGYAGEFLPQVRLGAVRLLGVMDSEPSPFYPDVPTLESMGVDLTWASSRGYSVPAGTPQEVVDVLEAATERVMQSEEMRTRMEDMGQIVRYLGPEEFAAYWDEVDAEVEQLVPLMD
jgi:tripartite-type tricarboxylate transporter receptor subunit TctC